jgi:hypothetical protein
MKEYIVPFSVVAVCLTALVITCLFLDTEQSRLVIEWIGKGIAGAVIIGLVGACVLFFLALF